MLSFEEMGKVTNLHNIQGHSQICLHWLYSAHYIRCIRCNANGDCWGLCMVERNDSLVC